MKATYLGKKEGEVVMQQNRPLGGFVALGGEVPVKSCFTGQLCCIPRDKGSGIEEGKIPKSKK